MKILMQFVRISVKRILAYPNEIYMVFLQALVSVVSTALFWAVLFSGEEAYGKSQEFVYILAMIALLSNGVQELFFGLRDLEYLVQAGEFDRYLYLPRSPLLLRLGETLPVVPMCQQILIALAGIALVTVRFGIMLTPGRFFKCVGFLLLGTVYYQMIYGAVTFLCLRTENISSLRDLIFQFGDYKQYPLGIFPIVIRFFLTYIIPMGLVAYYPTVLLLGLDEPLPQLYLAMPLAAAACWWSYRTSIKKYASNGG